MTLDRVAKYARIAKLYSSRLPVGHSHERSHYDGSSQSPSEHNLQSYAALNWHKGSSLTGLFEGKKGLILGVANDRSIAWAIAEQIMATGGELLICPTDRTTIRRRIVVESKSVLRNRHPAVSQSFSFRWTFKTTKTLPR
jgi:hypothetical protein